MTLWLSILAAFCLGLAAACLLEADWLRHARPSRSGSKRPWLYGSLAALCLCLAVVLWAHSRTPAPALFAAISRLPAPLPPPLVSKQQVPVPPVDEEATSDNEWQTGYQLPLPDALKPDAPTRLRIPALKVNRPIVPVMVRDGAWDVAALGGNVGLLATTGQHPGDHLAMVFAGHMTFPDGRLLEQGAFATLQYAIYGTEIWVETEGETAVYRVSEIGRIPPDAVERLYLADGDSILLITCTDWADHEQIYASRFLVRATRVGPLPRQSAVLAHAIPQ